MPGDAHEPRVIVTIFSAGVDPWLDIEKRAQEKILRQVEGHFAKVIWFQGSPEISHQLRYRLLNWLIRRQINLFYIKPRLLRRLIKGSWKSFEWNAIGSSQLLRMMQKRGTRPQKNGPDDRIVQDFPIHLPLSGVRTLDALRYVLESYEFDYLLRINSTCLPAPEEIGRLVKRLPSERVYGGRPLQFAGTRFISGAAILLSRDVVEGITKHATSFFFNLWEDVGLGQLIQAKNLGDIFEIDRLDLTRAEEVPSERTEGWPGAFVVRCKAEAPATTLSEPVISIMNAVSRHIVKA